jgi:predicted CXXCH cytochrome family protein
MNHRGTEGTEEERRGDSSTQSTVSAAQPARCVSVVQLLFFFLLAAAATAQTPAGMVHTKHNLSVSGPGPVRALTETRICIFCHTPHNATPLSPLWNKDIEPQAYTVYTSPTLKAGPLSQPSGPTKLCLTCHDGTIALGAVVNPAGGIAMAGSNVFPSGSLSNFGLDLSGHHPVSFAYHDALPSAELASSPPPGLVYGGMDEVHCSTCHDPHDDTNGKFLAKDNRYSALCTTCHQMVGWSTSAHATSTASVVGILPRPPKTWPAYTQLNEWGCEVCHTPHFAPTAQELLNFTAAPPEPFSCISAGCHSAAPPAAHTANAGLVASQVGAIRVAPTGTVDVARQTRKVSAHHEPLGVAPVPRQVLGGATRTGIRSVTCTDCHNPHLTTTGSARPPFASGMLRGVTGIDRYGGEVSTARFEYEICFKCHGDNTPDLDYVPRVVPSTNLRLAFDPSNPSYHPIVTSGKNLNIPSIPSNLEPAMSPTVMIYCTTCHADDEGGSRGPHGSSFPPILKERYETTDNTPESYTNYALCYRCHSQSSILSNVSFKHSQHLRANTPCSACHDPHGVDAAAGPPGTGDHAHLINFDTRVVLPYAGQYPTYRATSTFSGSCNLCCHNVAHSETASTCPPTALARHRRMPKAVVPNAPGVMLPNAAPPVAAPSAVGPCVATRTVCGVYP